MKKMILIAALTFSIGVYAQDMKDMKTDKKDQQNASMKDHIMMQDGRVMVMKDGKSMVMTADMTMGNGTIVMKDGTVMMKNGTNRPLKEGEVMYIDDNMNKMKMKDHSKTDSHSGAVGGMDMIHQGMDMVKSGKDLMILMVALMVTSELADWAW